MKDNTRKIAGVVLIIAVVFVVMFVIKPEWGERLKPFASSVIDQNTNSPSPFSCPTGEGITCQVKGTMNCNDANNVNSKVTARVSTTTDSLGRRYWVSLANDFGNLESWCPQTSLSASTIVKVKDVNVPLSGQQAFIGTYSGKAYLFWLKTGTTYYRYSIGSCGADLTPHTSCRL